MKFRNFIPTLLVALPLATQAWFMPYPKPAGKYPQANAADSASAHATLQSLYSSWKNLTGIGNGSIPFDNYTQKAVSEGVGYGLLFAVLFNDQPTFKALWAGAESKLWRFQDHSLDGWYAWVPEKADSANNWAATDADEDIALAMIFASALVRTGKWPATTFSGTVKGFPNTGSANINVTVEQKAVANLKSFRKYMIAGGVESFTSAGHLNHASMRYQLTDASTPAKKVILYNPSYFSPGWYRVFNDFMATNGESENFTTTIDKGYTMIQSQPGAAKGLVRDWSNEVGGQIKMGFFQGSLFSHVNDMYYDGIRAPFRLAVDAIWNPTDPDAVKYVNAAAGTSGSPSLWNNLDGGGSPNNEGGSENMSLAMWGAASAGGAAVGNSTAKTNLTKNWGNWKGTTQTDYFKGGLFLLGGLIMSGNFPNVWADLKSSFPDTSTKITTAVKMAPDTVRLTTKGDTSRIKATAAFSKAVVWTVYTKGRTSGHTKFYTAKAASSKLDTTFFYTTGTAGETFDVKVFWPNCKSADTSRTTFKLVTGNTGVLTKIVRQDLAIRMGANSLSIQVPEASGEAVRVRILDLAGRELRSFSAQPNQGKLEVSMADVGRGTQMLEIVDRDLVHRGLIPVVR